MQQDSCDDSRVKTNMKTVTGKATGRSGRLFRCQESLLTHNSRRKTDYSVFKCAVCGYTCKVGYDFKIHLQRHIGEKQFKCTVCDYAAVQSSELYTHFRNKHPSTRVFKCSTCTRSFATVKQFIRHTRLHLGALAGMATSGCTSKLKVKDRNVRRNTHQQPQVQPKATATHKSDRTARNQTQRQKCHRPLSSGYRGRQKLRHSTYKRYQCTVCEYSCAVPSSLAIHLRSHSGEKPYKCTLCDYATGYSFNFYAHMRNKHQDTKQFMCTVCDDSFVTPRQLMTHLKLHIDKGISKKNAAVATPTEDTQNQEPLTLSDADTKFQCDVCKERFAREETLFMHLEDHIGMPFTEETIQGFPGGGSLKMISDLGEDPAVGRKQLCGYRDRGRSELHIARNTCRPQSEKVFKCTMCAYSSKTKGSLSLHLVRHTGEKRHKCTACEHATGVISNLYNHMRRKHPHTKPFKCTVCDKAFVTPRLLRKHLQLHIG